MIEDGDIVDQPGWLSIDYLDDVEIGRMVVMPNFGPAHVPGMDCWCHPIEDDLVIIHCVHH